MKNIKTLRLLFYGMFAAGLFFTVASCATLPPGESSAMQVVELINTGDSAALKAMSADTLLCDSEILHGPVLIGSLWDGLVEAGFMLKGAEVIESRPASAADAASFGNNPETAVFFSAYLPDNPVLFRIASEGGSLLLVMAADENGDVKILAFGGPY